MTSQQIQFVFLLIVFLFSQLNTHASHSDPTGHLWTEFSSAESDSSKIRILLELTEYYHNIAGDLRMSDSASFLAVQIAESTFNSELKLNTYLSYIDHNDLNSYKSKAENIVKDADVISKQNENDYDNWRVALAYSKFYEKTGNYDLGLKYAYQGKTIADLLEKDELISKSYMAIALCLDNQNQEIEAFRNYLSALNYSEKTNNSKLQRTCLSALSRFFMFNKSMDKAREYKYKEAENLQKQNPIDSLAMMWIKFSLEEIDMQDEGTSLHTNNLKLIIDYAKRNHYDQLSNYALSLYRTHLIENNDIQGLYALYHTYYPEELEVLKNGNGGLYLRLQAYFLEYQGDLEAAKDYWKKADEKSEKMSHQIAKSNFNIRYGQFLVRNGMPEAAVEKFTKGITLASSTNYLPFVLSAGEELETLYASLGKYENAYEYADINHAVRGLIDKDKRKEELLGLEIDNETRRQKIIAEKEDEQRQRSFNLQYMAIVILIAFIFIFLILLGNMKVSPWIIRMLGFFSFIFFFEFIILLADNWIHGITHGEPWKIMGFKVILIAILLPIHHWIERKAVRYLLGPKSIKFPKFSLRNMVMDHIAKMGH